MPKISADHAAIHDDWDVVFKSGQFTEGQFVRKLEAEVEKQTSMFAVAMNSAGTALYALLRCAKVKKHGVIAVPNNTFFATAGAAVEAFGRNRVRLVDCERTTFSMDVEYLQRLHRFSQVDAVILTHVGGTIAYDYAMISEWCKEQGVPLFEDAAHAYGCPAEVLPGDWGDAAVYSLYPTKAIPAGEGGIVVTRDEKLAGRLRAFRNYGKLYDEDGTIKYTGIGFNFRMDEWTAVVAYHQVKMVKDIVGERTEAADRLRRAGFVNMIDRPTNYYKFITKEDPTVKRRAGQVYGLSDQMTTVLQDPMKMPNSKWVAENHMCLPIEEHMFEGMFAGDIAERLRS